MTRRWVRRLGQAPLAVHAAALGVVLIAVLPLTRPGVAYTSDEGAAVVQARLLERTDQWLLSDPLASVDPEVQARSFVRADSGPKGRAPYVKHPLYPVLLTAVDRSFGTTGMYMLGIAGTIVASLAAALLARGFRPGLAPAALWMTGLGSPLFFDSYVLLAHTIGAAACGLATVAAWRALQTVRTSAMIAVALPIAVAVALRTEAVFIGPGLALGALAAARLPEVRRRAALAVAVVAVAAAALAVAVESRVATAILGEGTASGAAALGAPSGGLRGHWEGFLRTWLAPGVTLSGVGPLAVFIAFSAITVATLLIRRRGGAASIVACLVVAVAACGVRLFSGTSAAVPGLAMAFPVGWAGLLLLDRQHLRSPAARLALTTAAVVTAGVVATQYANGGGVEWGGRYFAIVLPLAVPVLVAAIADQPWPRPGTALLVAVTTVLTATAAQSLWSVHVKTADLLESLDATASIAGPSGSRDRRPIVVTTERLLPQLAWDRYDRYQWLAPERDDVGRVLRRLRAAGARRIVAICAGGCPSDAIRRSGWRTESELRAYVPMKVLVRL